MFEAWCIMGVSDPYRQTTSPKASYLPPPGNPNNTSWAPGVERRWGKPPTRRHKCSPLRSDPQLFYLITLFFFKWVPDEPSPVDSDLYENAFSAFSDPGVLGFTHCAQTFCFSIVLL